MQSEKVPRYTRRDSDPHAFRRRNLNPPRRSSSVVYGRFQGASVPGLGALGGILAQGWPRFWDAFGGRFAVADGRPERSPTVAILPRDPVINSHRVKPILSEGYDPSCVDGVRELGGLRGAVRSLAADWEALDRHTSEPDAGAL